MNSHQEPELTPKQALFVRHYTTPGDTLFNGTESARQAGYKGSRNIQARQAYENLRKPKIHAAVRRILKEQFGAADLSIERVLNDIEFTRQLALRDGKYNAALKASELHGKYLRMWLDRVEHIHTIEDVTTDELVALAQRLARRIDGFDLNEHPGGNEPEALPGAGTSRNRKPH